MWFFVSFPFLDGGVVIPMTRHFRVIMFVHNKMSTMQFNFQKPSGASTLDIEGIDILFNLIKVTT